MPILGLPKSDVPLHPAHFDIEKVIRPNILALHPYRCARDDYKDGILLDANENALGHSIESTAAYLEEADTLDLHRYPNPSHDNIKTAIASLRDIPGPDHVFLGVGSDEVIDLLMRVCVAPGKEKVLITPPTYGMYAVCAQVNDVGVVKCPLELSGANGEGGLTGRFSLKVDEVCSVSFCLDSTDTLPRSRRQSTRTPSSSSYSFVLPGILLEHQYHPAPCAPSLIIPISKAS